MKVGNKLLQNQFYMGLELWDVNVVTFTSVAGAALKIICWAS